MAKAYLSTAIEEDDIPTFPSAMLNWMWQKNRSHNVYKITCICLSPQIASEVMMWKHVKRRVPAYSAIEQLLHHRDPWCGNRPAGLQCFHHTSWNNPLWSVTTSSLQCTMEQYPCLSYLLKHLISMSILQFIHNSMEFHLLVTKGHPFLLTSTPRRGPLCFKHRLGLAQTICWINEMQTIIDQIINGVTYLDMIQNSISINVSMQAPFRKKELQETTTRCLIH